MPAHRLLAAIACLAALGTGASAAYTVRAGDTLSGIAGRLGVSVGDLARANGIADPNRVFAGRTLSLPGAAAAPGTARLRPASRRFGSPIPLARASSPTETPSRPAMPERVSPARTV